MILIFSYIINTYLNMSSFLSLCPLKNQSFYQKLNKINALFLFLFFSINILHERGKHLNRRLN
jgi:hypothetical protein